MFYTITKTCNQYVHTITKICIQDVHTITKICIQYVLYNNKDFDTICSYNY